MSELEGPRVTQSTIKVLNDYTRLILRMSVGSQVLLLKLYCRPDFTMKIFLVANRDRAKIATNKIERFQSHNADLQNIQTESVTICKYCVKRVVKR